MALIYSVRFTTDELAAVLEASVAGTSKQTKKMLQKLAKKMDTAIKKKGEVKPVGFTVWDYIGVLRGYLGDRLLVPAKADFGWGAPLNRALRSNQIEAAEADEIGRYVSTWTGELDVNYLVYKSGILLTKARRDNTGLQMELNLGSGKDEPTWRSL